ncbi:hypothetical protein HDU89_006897 [Geranomyces variabilis]|nr:hypothetical protein HDU89_006897 [Geranomyces variabilis]
MSFVMTGCTSIFIRKAATAILSSNTGKKAAAAAIDTNRRSLVSVVTATTSTSEPALELDTLALSDDSIAYPVVAGVARFRKTHRFENSTWV